uniref:Uncharacterized protein n=1 Tax=Lepeophtheirus salmonis TaxID=72036 RepID=A0A0K2TJH9_LEPSM
MDSSTNSPIDPSQGLMGRYKDELDRINKDRQYTLWKQKIIFRFAITKSARS